MGFTILCVQISSLCQVGLGVGYSNNSGDDDKMMKVCTYIVYYNFISNEHHEPGSALKADFCESATTSNRNPTIQVKKPM